MRTWSFTNFSNGFYIKKDKDSRSLTLEDFRWHLRHEEINLVKKKIISVKKHYFNYFKKMTVLNNVISVLVFCAFWRFFQESINTEVQIVWHKDRLRSRKVCSASSLKNVSNLSFVKAAQQICSKELELLAPKNLNYLHQVNFWFLQWFVPASDPARNSVFLAVVCLLCFLLVGNSQFYLHCNSLIWQIYICTSCQFVLDHAVREKSHTVVKN